MKNSQLSDGHSLIFIVFFFIFLIAGRNQRTLKCKSGAFAFNPLLHGGTLKWHNSKPKKISMLKALD